MRRYIFRIYYRNNDDGENIWIDAESTLSALSQLKREYPYIKDYELIDIRR